MCTYPYPPEATKPGSDRPQHTRWRAFLVSLEGLADAFKNQQAFRLELMMIVPVSLGGWLREFSLVRWLFALGIIGVILGLELLNTALEVLCDDLYGLQSHPAVKRVKDLGSAAILAMILTGIAGYSLCLIWPH